MSLGHNEQTEKNVKTLFIVLNQNKWYKENTLFHKWYETHPQNF